MRELSAEHEGGGGLGIPVPGLHFVASEELKDGASEAFAGYEAAVIFPYDVSQMRLYEFYALGIPILLPDLGQLPSYVYRGLTTIDDFNHTLPGASRDAVGDVRKGGAHMDHDPFDRGDWTGVAAWTELTHWVTLPHLLHCRGAAEMVLRLAREDLRPVSAGMRRRQERDLIRAVRFWGAALVHLGLQ